MIVDNSRHEESEKGKGAVTKGKGRARKTGLRGVLGKRELLKFPRGKWKEDRS